MGSLSIFARGLDSDDPITTHMTTYYNSRAENRASEQINSAKLGNNFRTVTYVTAAVFSHPSQCIIMGVGYLSDTGTSPTLTIFPFTWASVGIASGYRYRTEIDQLGNCDRVIYMFLQLTFTIISLNLLRELEESVSRVCNEFHVFYFL